MNTFEQLLGRQITNVLRVDIKEDYEFDIPLALFFKLDEEAGLLIGQDLENETTTVSFMILEDVKHDYGTEYFETCLNELKPLDRLNTLKGQTIKSIKVGEFYKEKVSAGTFVVKTGQFAGAIIEVGDQKLTVFNSDKGLEILFNSDLLFPNPQTWRMN
jgi:hypothetical protein